MQYYYLAAAIEITSANNVIIFRENGSGTDRTATITVGTYFLYGEGTESGDILKAITDALTAGSGVAATYTTVAATTEAAWQAGYYSFSWNITTSSTSWELRGAAVATTFPLSKIGLLELNTGFAATQGSTEIPTHSWIGDQPPVRLDPSSYRKEVKTHVTPQGQRHFFSVGSTLERRTLEWQYLSSQVVFGEGGAFDLRAFEYFYEIINDGTRFRLYIEDDIGTYQLDSLAAADLVGTYTLAESSLREWAPVRTDGTSPYYSFSLECDEYVA